MLVSLKGRKLNEKDVISLRRSLEAFNPGDVVAASSRDIVADGFSEAPVILKPLLTADDLTAKGPNVVEPSVRKKTTRSTLNAFSDDELANSDKSGVNSASDSLEDDEETRARTPQNIDQPLLRSSLALRQSFDQV